MLKKAPRAKAAWEQVKPHPCQGCTVNDLQRCPFRSPGTYSQVCSVCGKPIFADECWQIGSGKRMHVRCEREPQPRPEWMDKLKCL